jgi:5-methylthioadenosine/S-adenosylhomocysteine deaminase
MRLSSISLLFCTSLIFAATPAELIISAGQVLTMDADHHVILNGAVAVSKGRILAVGPKAEIDKAYTAARRIDRPTGILIPGLINTHTHAAMSLLRGVADDMELDTWLKRYIFPAEAKNVNEAFVRAGTRLAMLEMMLGGTTTFVDMYYFEQAVADEARKAGMRGVLGETIINFPAPDYKSPADALAGTERFIQAYRKDALITPAVAPHAIYTNTTETLKAARALANKYDVPFIIHVSETQVENVNSATEHDQLTPTRYLESIGVLDSGRTLFAHMVWATPADASVVARRKVGIAHCPSSNMKLASGMFNYNLFLPANIPMGLGTDGPAGSNNDFDMFEEMDLASKAAKTFTSDPRKLPARRALAMATIEGARALGMDKEIGSLETGKRADLVVVGTDSPNAWPAHDPYAMLVYALKASDVSDVVIEGRTTVLQRKPQTLNPATIRREAEALRAKVEASLKAQ